MSKRFCKNCNEKIRKIRDHNANNNFCSQKCRYDYYQKMHNLIKIKEKELQKLKVEIENAKGRN